MVAESVESVTSRRALPLGLIVFALIGWTLGLTASCVAVDYYDGRKSIDLLRWLDHPQLVNERMATEDLCNDTIPCIQALESEEVNLYRFEDGKLAAAAAVDLDGDSYVAGWIVAEFKSAGMSPEEQDSFLTGFYCTYTNAGSC